MIVRIDVSARPDALPHDADFAADLREKSEAPSSDDPKLELRKKVTMKPKSHVVMWVNTSAAARDTLLDSRDGMSNVEMLADALMPALVSYFEDRPIPDINGLYPLLERVDGAVVCALCKPRGYRRAIEQVGWAVALLTETEVETIEALPPEQRDAALIARIDATPEQVAKWQEYFR